MIETEKYLGGKTRLNCNSGKKIEVDILVEKIIKILAEESLTSEEASYIVLEVQNKIRRASEHVAFDDLI